MPWGMVGSIASSPAVDLSALPPPVLVEQPDFETRLAAKQARFVELTEGQFDALLESDPAMVLLEADSYDEQVSAQDFNDKANGLLLPYAEGDNLDVLGALNDVPRLVVTAATATADAVMEKDAAYRQRIQLSRHAFSVAGPDLAYKFHARSAHGDVADAVAYSPQPDDIKAKVLAVLADHAASAELVAAMTAMLETAAWPGAIQVAVQSVSGTGVPPGNVLEVVDAALQGVRPMTDFVTVQAAQPVGYDIVAEIYPFAGPDADLILTTAKDSLDTFLAANRKLGRDVACSAHTAALHVGNVQRVKLISPPADIPIDWFQFPQPTSISVTVAGTEL